MGEQMRRRRPFLWITIATLTFAGGALAKAPKPLQIYFIDVEGGQATLAVSPSRESMLIDTGWPNFNGRDADRIVRAAKAAKIKQIDYVLITHYHRDHGGGVTQLAERMKVGAFVDGGAVVEGADAAGAGEGGCEQLDGGGGGCGVTVVE